MVGLEDGVNSTGDTKVDNYGPSRGKRNHGVSIKGNGTVENQGTIRVAPRCVHVGAGEVTNSGTIRVASTVRTLRVLET